MPQGLQLSEEDPARQVRYWKLQRAGWALLAGFIVLAPLGLFGDGPVSWVTAGQRDAPLWVEYERFARFKSWLTFRIHLNPVDGTHHSSVLRLSVSTSFIGNAPISHLTPSPTSTRIGPDRITYEIPAEAAAHPGTSYVITLYVRTSRFGRLHGEFSLDGGPTVAFTQLIYP